MKLIINNVYLVFFEGVFKIIFEDLVGIKICKIEDLFYVVIKMDVLFVDGGYFVGDNVVVNIGEWVYGKWESYLIGDVIILSNRLELKFKRCGIEGLFKFNVRVLNKLGSFEDFIYGDG